MITDKARATGKEGRRGRVMKDKELKLEEIEASHTLGGAGEGRDQGEGSGKKPSETRYNQ